MKRYFRSAAGRLLSTSMFVFFAGAGTAGLSGSYVVLAVTTLLAVCVAVVALGMGVEEFPRATLLVTILVPLALLPLFWLVQMLVESYWYPNGSVVAFVIASGPGLNALVPRRARLRANGHRYWPGARASRTSAHG